MVAERDDEDDDGSDAGLTDRAASTFELAAAVELSERLIRVVEVVAAYVLVALFAVGVFDLGLQILGLLRTGRITDPLAVIQLIDIVLLLFIIVEIYETVVAYAQAEERSTVLRTVIYAGVIAMVRKAIVFRVDEYSMVTDALAAATAYLLIIVGLAALLYVSARET